MALSTIGANQLALTSAAMPAGSVLQCVTTNYSNDFIFSLSASGNASDNGKLEVATGLNCSITPISTSSKVLYQATVYIGANLWYDIGIHVIKNATATTATTSHTDTSPCGGSYLSDSSGNAIRGQTSNSTPRGTGLVNTYFVAGSSATTGNYTIAPFSCSLLDHPNTTSQITYNFAISWYAWENYNLYLNRTSENQQQALYDTNPVSTVTLMEIAG
mgnify:CR=1 FL=1|tara:strand:- start:50 stop:700 length:651 start_codon:yes stop_codon:yes gene_type:complete